jgi:hypothetical protein
MAIFKKKQLTPDEQAAVAARKEQLERDLEKFNNTYGKGLTVGRELYTKLKGGPAQSIASRAAKNIFEFPVFVSKSVPLNYATATCSLLEQMYASFLQMTISLAPIVDMEAINSGNPFSGLKTASINAFLECGDWEFSQEACYNRIQSENGTFEFSLVQYNDDTAQAILESVENMNIDHYTHFFAEAKTDDGKGKGKDKNKGKDGKTKSSGSNPKTLDDLGYRYEDTAVDDEGNPVAQRRTTRKDRQEDRDQRKFEDELGYRLDSGTTRKDRQEKRDQASFEDTVGYDPETGTTRKDRQEQRDELASQMNFQKTKNDFTRTRSEVLKQAEMQAPVMLRDQDVTKINTMKPLLMNAQMGYVEKNNSGEAIGIQKMNYVVGVKTFVRLIDPKLMPEVVKFPDKNNVLLKKAKYRAGELKYWRDFKFDIKGKKQAAYDIGMTPEKKWYHRLYQMAHLRDDALAPMVAAGGLKGLTKRWNTAKTGMIPNCSIVITQEDVNYIKSETGKDLMKPGTAASLCREMFLISFVVIDIDQEAVKILIPDMHKDFEVQSLDAINKQLSVLNTSGVKTNEIFKHLQ